MTTEPDAHHGSNSLCWLFFSLLSLSHYNGCCAAVATTVVVDVHLPVHPPCKSYVLWFRLIPFHSFASVDETFDACMYVVAEYVEALWRENSTFWEWRLDCRWTFFMSLYSPFGLPTFRTPNHRTASRRIATMKNQSFVSSSSHYILSNNCLGSFQIWVEVEPYK